MNEKQKLVVDSIYKEHEEEVKEQISKNHLRFGSWHNSFMFSPNNWRIEFTGLATGCGLMQMFHFVEYFRFDFEKHPQYKNDFLTFIYDTVKEEIDNNNYACGTFIATLGSHHFKYNPIVEKNLLLCGFVEIANYINIAHLDNDKSIKNQDIQKLYILTLDFNEITENFDFEPEYNQNED